MTPLKVQVLDQHGHFIHKPSRDMMRLSKAGWRIVSITQRGLVKMVIWADPTDGKEYPQHNALEILEQRN